MADTKLISEVLVKMIDSQISNTQALTSLKGSLNEANGRLKDIDVFFRNGFREDIRKLLSALNHKKIEEIEKTLHNIKEQNKLWVKMVALIVGLGAIVTAVMKFAI